MFSCSSIQWNKLAKKNWWKSSWVKDAKWLGRVHQLDLQTCTLPERLKRMQKHYRVEDAKRITQFSSARFANTPEWLNISFFLIWIINKSILFNKSDERLWKRVSDRKLKKNPSVLVTSYLQLAQSSRLGIGIKLYSTWE